MNIILVKYCERQKNLCLIVSYVRFGRKKLPVFSGGWKILYFQAEI